jgi:EAL domain-containing protein (putative c-di-GMP-specific phosphodiesterase class I)
LLDGLERDEFVLHYQPIFGLQSGRIDRFEALCRWEHPRRGHLLPVDFIDLTEHDGVGSVFTAAVLRQAATDCVSWQRDGTDAGVAVNISPRMLVDLTIPQLVEGILERTALDPSSLTLELTEGAGGVGLTAITGAVKELASIGVRISLDDFGCADSSLARLQTLPLSEIKIDRRFITHLPDNETDATIVRFITGLGRDLGLDVVAEGIEYPGALAFVRQLSVTSAQGFLLARPAPMGALTHP